MKKYVQISNNGVTRIVTAGLQSINTTNMKSPRADRLSVQPSWTKMSITIKTGMGYYPAEISTWNTVKDLAKDGILTIGIFTDECKESEAVDALQKKIDLAKRKYESDVIRNQEILAQADETTGTN